MNFSLTHFALPRFSSTLRRKPNSIFDVVYAHPWILWWHQDNISVLEWAKLSDHSWFMDLLQSKFTGLHHIKGSRSRSRRIIQRWVHGVGLLDNFTYLRWCFFQPYWSFPLFCVPTEQFGDPASWFEIYTALDLHSSVWVRVTNFAREKQGEWGCWPLPNHQHF